MLFAGIAWTDTGFDVAVLDERARLVAAARHFPAGQVQRLTDHLRALQRSDRLVCVLDSTSGMLDPGLVGVGLRVHRADPEVLPPRPAFGSVDAEALARAGLTHLSRLPRLDVEGGSLPDRMDEHARYLAESRPLTDLLVEAGRCLYHGARDEPGKLVSLTFDDGPHPPYTARILDVLDRYGVPATFFCVGLHATGHREQLARMAEAGHGVGNHTWSHPFLPDLSVQELAAQLRRTDDVLADVVPPHATALFRPPYGSRTAAQLDWLLGQSSGPMVVLWDVNPRDWSLPGAEVIAQRTLEQVRPGSVVLMHDGGGDRSQTAEALPAIIEGLLARGFGFTRVDQLRA